MTMPSEKPLGLTHKCSENRRASKPLMEKRRRARINRSLGELKSLVLDAVKKDSQSSRHTKLEKADILEMAVKHLQNLHREKLAASFATGSNAEDSFNIGFSECAREATQFVSNTDGTDPSLSSRLRSHLTLCLNAFANAASEFADDCASTSSSNRDSQTPSPMNVDSPAPSCSPVSISIPRQDSPSLSNSSNSPCSYSFVISPNCSNLTPVSLYGNGLSGRHYSVILPGSYAEPSPQLFINGPLDLATGSSAINYSVSDSQKDNHISMKSNEKKHIAPCCVLNHQMEKPHEATDDHVWRPW